MSGAGGQTAPQSVTTDAQTEVLLMYVYVNQFDLQRFDLVFILTTRDAITRSCDTAEDVPREHPTHVKVRHKNTGLALRI